MHIEVHIYIYTYIHTYVYICMYCIYLYTHAHTYGKRIRGPFWGFVWVAVKELNLSYHHSETIFFTLYIYPYYGKLSSLTASQPEGPISISPFKEPFKGEPSFSYLTERFRNSNRVFSC